MKPVPPRAGPAKRAAPRFFQLVPPDTSIDFVRHFRRCAALSLAALLASALALPLRGIRVGVDFAGGYQIVAEIASEPPVDESDVRAALASAGFGDADVIREGEVAEGVFQIRFAATEGRDPADAAHAVQTALGAVAGASAVTIEKADFVGPRVGAELRGQALKSLAIAFLLISGYVALRFAPAFAPGAIVALIHDVALTAGIFVLLGWEFDMGVLAALLTIVGYSINDTIVIFDRIRELRARRSNFDPAAIVNLAINETLSRTLLTSGTTLIAVLALLLFGGTVLRGFSAALAIGIVVGTYSSVYVAAPVLLWVESLRALRPASPPTSGAADADESSSS